MLITDYLGTKVLDKINNKFEQYVKQDELQKILLQCFKDAKDREKSLEGFEVDSDVIMRVNPINIQPNLPPFVIEKNLCHIFDKIINIDNKDKQRRLKTEITLSYLKKAREDTLSLFHIQEDIDNISLGIDEIKTMSQSQTRELDVIKTMSQRHIQELDIIRNELQKQPGVTLQFIEELECSKAFFYLRFEMSYYIEDDEEREEIFELFDSAIEQSGVNAHTEFYIHDMVQCVNVVFDEPALQYLVRELLKILDDSFETKGIKIYSVTTHL